jgi:glycosyl transferase, family 25
MFVGVINLASSTSRRETITADLVMSNTTAEIIEAIDGRGRAADGFDAYNARMTRLRHGRDLNGGEVACYLSHLEALRRFLASGEDIGLILEDDIHFTTCGRDEIVALTGFLRSGFLDWQIVNLTQHDHRCCRQIGSLQERAIFKAYYFPMLTGANLWTRAAATAFLATRYALEVRGPFDTEVRSFCALMGRGVSLSPPPLTTRAVKSDIDQSQTARNAMRDNRRPVMPRLVRHFPDIARARLKKLVDAR